MEAQGKGSLLIQSEVRDSRKGFSEGTLEQSLENSGEGRKGRNGRRREGCRGKKSFQKKEENVQRSEGP